MCKQGFLFPFLRRFDVVFQGSLVHSKDVLDFVLWNALGSMWKFNANKAVFVTSSDFTVQAGEQAKGAPIELWNHGTLEKFVEKYFIEATHLKASKENTEKRETSIHKEALAVEKSFNLKALAEWLEKVFPRLISLYEDQGFIWVMGKIKITENGVVEGTGPAAERVQKVYDQFLSEMTK